MCSVGDFLCVWLLANYLLIRIRGVVVWVYVTIFIITSKITALSGRNRSVMLTYIYTHILPSSCLLESDDDRQTHTRTHTLISRAVTRIHLGARLVLPLPVAFPLHTRTSRYLLKIWLMMTDTHAHTHIH